MNEKFWKMLQHMSPCAKFMRRHEDSSYSNHGRKTRVKIFADLYIWLKFLLHKYFLVFQQSVGLEWSS